METVEVEETAVSSYAKPALTRWEKRVKALKNLVAKTHPPLVAN
jgi:hypothetical protein